MLRGGRGGRGGGEGGAVTFDFGQTLAELDTAMLSRRLAERAMDVPAARLDEAVVPAWRTYDAAITSGVSRHPWKLLMAELLRGAGAEAAALDAAVDWLWDEQPRRNLWRRPIAGMIELVDALRAEGVAVGVVSNSEGRLAELVDEMGWSGRFAVIADSGKLGLEKPEPAIFAWTAERLGVPLGEVIHVGDSYAADVEGALRAGARAIWFRGREERALPARVRCAADAPEVRAAVAALRAGAGR